MDQNFDYLGKYIPADGCRPENRRPRAAKRKNRWISAAALCLACTLLGGAGGIAAGAWYFDAAGSAALDENVSVPAAVDIAYTSASQTLSPEEIYACWVGSTVGITTETVTASALGQQISAGAGSGFVISSEGYILTNYHVIDGAGAITVTFSDGAEYDAALVGGEESNDIAVLKIEASGLTPVVIGDSDALRVGQSVTAIGNPLGELTFSQTAGIVSALNRTVTLSSGLSINMLQTDCTINPGNSGGPLFNSSGEVIGITSAKYSNNGSDSEASIEGIGFAIPINDVIGMVQDIIEFGYVTGKPNLGVLLNDVDAAAQRYGVPAGAEVLAVLDGSCAQQAGLQAGDIITAVEDTQVTDCSQLQSAVQSFRAGDTVLLTVYRDGDSISAQLTLDEADQTRTQAMADLEEEYSQSQQQSWQSDSGYQYGPGR